MKNILLIAIIAMILPQSIEAQLTLTPKWQAGDSFHYVIEEKESGSSSFGDKSFGLSVSLILDTTWKVEKMLPNGSFKLSVHIDRLRYQANGLGEAKEMVQNLQIDSDQDVEPKRSRENLLKSTFKEYVGHIGAVTINNRGEVTDFTLSEKLSEFFESTLVREYSGFYGDLFTKDGLKRRLTNWLVAFPAEPVSIGKTWTQKLSGRFLLKENVYARNFKLVGPAVKDGKSIVQVDFTSKVNSGDEATWKISSQKGSGQVLLESQSHNISHFALSEHIKAASGMSGVEMNTVYSATLRGGDAGKPPVRDEPK